MAPRRPSGRAKRGGQILILAILAMTMLVGLIFYVYNLGDQVNRRVSMQNAADAAAVSGAGWMARSMNVVAMNNVAQTRMIALVPVMDAIPLASEMAFNEVDAWSEGLSETVDGVRATAALARAVRERILRGLESLLGRLRTQSDALEPMLDMDAEIEQACTWTLRGVGGPPPHGGLWRAAVTLDEFSQATVASAGVLAQANAVRFGEANGGGTAFLTPVLPQMPVIRRQLSDFDTVLRKQMLVDLEDRSGRIRSGGGGAVPDAVWPYRLGPWARLFRHPHAGTRGWRRPWGPQVPDGPPRTREVPPREGREIIGPSAGGGRAGGGADRGQGAQAGGTQTWQPMRTDVRGYTTFGPYDWAKGWVVDYANVALRDTRFREYYNLVADTKLGYVFAGINPPLSLMHSPLWITDLTRARELGGDATIRKTLTRYYYIEVISKSPESSAQWASSITSDNLSNPVTRDFSGWLAPERIKQQFFGGSQAAVEGPDQVGSLGMWRFTATGMERLFHSDGTLKDEWPVYFSWYFIFGGLDVGGDVMVSNPANWDRFDELPAPTLLDTSDGDYIEDPDEGIRREHFAYLGIVRRPGSSAVWSQRFSPANPAGSLLAAAQAKVFNNTSWDLWTQDWQAQLTRLRGWSDWTLRVGDGVADVQYTGATVSGEELDLAYEYMSALDSEMAELYVNH